MTNERKHQTTPRAQSPASARNHPRNQEAAAPVRNHPRTAEFPVIVIAASAGGVEALQKILAQLPHDFPAAVFVVLHRRPTPASVLSRVLARSTPMHVTAARPGDPVRAGNIYVAPADQHVTIEPDRTIALSDGRRIKHVLSSADPLFETAAGVFGKRVIGVVLTGGDSDASDGVHFIRAAGGKVLAQDRATSKVFAMPQAAIATGFVDMVLPLQEIAPTLVHLVKRGRNDDGNNPRSSKGANGGKRA